MSHYSAPIIPARCCSSRWSGSRRLIALACLAACGAFAQSLETVAANYRKTPNARTRAAVVRFADLHRSDRNGALALLVLGATEIDQRQFGDAITHLTAARKRLPELADHVAYLSSLAQSGLRDFPAVEKLLSPVWGFAPASPLVGKAVSLQAHAYLDSGEAAKAVALVEQHRKDLPGTDGELLLAQAYEASGNSSAAAEHYLKIYSEQPLAKEASDAEAALARFPAPSPHVLLVRGLRLVDGGDYARAAKELTALLPQLSGADLDVARVRIGAARYLARDNKPAADYLGSFESATPESEAERLYYLLQSQRRLERIDDMQSTLNRIAASYPQSPWYLQALITSANYYSAHNQADVSEQLYRSCFGSFPNDPESAQCHWKVAWTEYLRDPGPSESMLREHLQRYPQSDHVSPALYFLGRIAESRSDWASARAYYEEINRAYPNYYYAMLARERLRFSSIAAATRSQDTAQFLSTVRVTERKVESFEASTLTRQRIDRAHLLATAGLDELAEAELRFGAKADGQPQIMALELAQLASQRESPDQGIRYIKHFAPGYLSMAIENAPPKFWQLAFPMPYRRQLEEDCRALSLDPYLVAALIRQESEFNPKAISKANARGLTQVLPSTGRQVSRQLKMRGFRTAMLYSPDTNLKIGTYYLRALFDQLDGKWEATLASYNAGKSRVTGWMATGTFHEPAEFVESIPFNETRVYVQSVLRNAEVYRRLYGQKAP
jgi:soluble lytic murein transglycosylase